MIRRIAMATSALNSGDDFRVAVQRAWLECRLSGVAEKTIRGDRACQIRLDIMFVSGREVPQTPVRVISYRSLVEAIQILECETPAHAPGADVEGQRHSATGPDQLQVRRNREPPSGFSGKLRRRVHPSGR